VFPFWGKLLGWTTRGSPMPLLSTQMFSLCNARSGEVVFCQSKGRRKWIMPKAPDYPLPQVVNRQSYSFRRILHVKGCKNLLPG